MLTPEAQAVLNQYYTNITQMTRAVIFNFQDNIAVMGPPGIGKLHTVQEELDRHGTPSMRFMCAAMDNYDLQALREALASDNVLIFDEAHSFGYHSEQIAHELVRAIDSGRKGMIFMITTDTEGGFGFKLPDFVRPLINRLPLVVKMPEQA